MSPVDISWRPFWKNAFAILVSILGRSPSSGAGVSIKLGNEMNISKFWREWNGHLQILRKVILLTSGFCPENYFYQKCSFKNAYSAHEWRNCTVAEHACSKMTKHNTMFHKNKLDSIIRASGAIFYSLLHFNWQLGFKVLKCVYSVISVIEKRLSGNTKKWTIAPFLDGQSAITRIVGGRTVLLAFDWCCFHYFIRNSLVAFWKLCLLELPVLQILFTH